MKNEAFRLNKDQEYGSVFIKCEKHTCLVPKDADIPLYLQIHLSVKRSLIHISSTFK